MFYLNLITNNMLYTESIKRLESVISGDAADLHDTAVTAFGRICFNSSNCIRDDVTWFIRLKISNGSFLFQQLICNVYCSAPFFLVCYFILIHNIVK